MLVMKGRDSVATYWKDFIKDVRIFFSLMFRLY